MTKNRSGLFYVAVIVLAVILLCQGQSISGNMAAIGEEAVREASIGAALIPEKVEAEEGEAAEENISSLLLPRTYENAMLVTAEGAISDYLWPEDENTDDGADQDEVDIDSIATRTYTVTGKPNVLIYHTHTTEAYRQDGSYTYKASGDSRTEETDKNIVAVGEELRRQLEAQGFSVIHDTTDHEPPKLATSYSRSLETMEMYREKYPDMDIYIDVHRDAANVETQQDDVVVIDGERCARLMFVVGTGEGKSGNGYSPKPNWTANYALAKSICSKLDEIDANFTRDIRVKTGRYNQHVTDMCLLVEVGHNANTLDEALNSMKHLAKSMRAVITPA